MTGTILRCGNEVEVSTTRKPCHWLGDTTGIHNKRQCEESSDYLPIYHCVLYRLCSPFGKNTDPDLIHDCEECSDYRSKLAVTPVNMG